MTSWESDKKVNIYAVSKYTLLNVTFHDLRICKKDLLHAVF
jgi:hypothetical protein